MEGLLARHLFPLTKSNPSSEQKETGEVSVVFTHHDPETQEGVVIHSNTFRDAGRFRTAGSAGLLGTQWHPSSPEAWESGSKPVSKWNCPFAVGVKHLHTIGDTPIVFLAGLWSLPVNVRTWGRGMFPWWAITGHGALQGPQFFQDIQTSPVIKRTERCSFVGHWTALLVKSTSPV